MLVICESESKWNWVRNKFVFGTVVINGNVKIKVLGAADSRLMIEAPAGTYVVGQQYELELKAVE